MILISHHLFYYLEIFIPHDYYYYYYTHEILKIKLSQIFLKTFFNYPFYNLFMELLI